MFYNSKLTSIQFVLNLCSDFCLQTNKFCYVQNQHLTLLIGGIEVPEGKMIC